MENTIHKYKQHNKQPYKKGGGRNCAVVGCSNNQRKMAVWRAKDCDVHIGKIHADCPCLEPFKLFFFPKQFKKRYLWIVALNRKGYNPGKTAVVCSEHFVDGKPTESNPVPTLALGFDINNGGRYFARKLRQGCISMPESDISRNLLAQTAEDKVYSPNPGQISCINKPTSLIQSNQTALRKNSWFYNEDEYGQQSRDRQNTLINSTMSGEYDQQEQDMYIMCNSDIADTSVLERKIKIEPDLNLMEQNTEFCYETQEPSIMSAVQSDQNAADVQTKSRHPDDLLVTRNVSSGGLCTSDGRTAVVDFENMDLQSSYNDQEYQNLNTCSLSSRNLHMKNTRIKTEDSSLEIQSYDNTTDITGQNKLSRGSDYSYTGTRLSDISHQHRQRSNVLNENFGTISEVDLEDTSFTVSAKCNCCDEVIKVKVTEFKKLLKLFIRPEFLDELE